MAEKKIVSRVGVLSYAKISAIISAIIGLILGIFYAILFSIIGATGAAATGEPSAGLFAGLGFAMIIVMPIFYGIIGFIFGALGAFVYNLVAKWVGGIELDFD